jgi:hypothetical protein
MPGPVGRFVRDRTVEHTDFGFDQCQFRRHFGNLPGNHDVPEHAPGDDAENGDELGQGALRSGAAQTQYGSCHHRADGALAIECQTVDTGADEEWVLNMLAA